MYLCFKLFNRFGIIYYYEKIFLSFLLIAVAALCAVAAGKEGKAAISFSSTRHDFGTIGDDKQVTAVYEFENTGTAPLVIISVTNGGCGCTRPSFTKSRLNRAKKAKFPLNSTPAAAPASSTAR